MGSLVITKSLEELSEDAQKVVNEILMEEIINPRLTREGKKFEDFDIISDVNFEITFDDDISE